jgi:rubrerythrin
MGLATVERKQASPERAFAMPGDAPESVVCNVCGYSPNRRIPDRCPVCLSHRDHSQPVP